MSAAEQQAENYRKNLQLSQDDWTEQRTKFETEIDFSATKKLGFFF